VSKILDAAEASLSPLIASALGYFESRRRNEGFFFSYQASLGKANCANEGVVISYSSS